MLCPAVIPATYNFARLVQAELYGLEEAVATGNQGKAQNGLKPALLNRSRIFQYYPTVIMPTGDADMVRTLEFAAV